MLLSFTLSGKKEPQTQESLVWDGGGAADHRGDQPAACQPCPGRVQALHSWVIYLTSTDTSPILKTA